MAPTRLALAGYADPDRKLAITLMAHTLRRDLRIVATGRNDPRGALLERAGAPDVIVVDDLIAGALVERLSRPPPHEGEAAGV